MNTTPVSLLERLRMANDEGAWERFVDLYTPLLCYWGRRLDVPETDVPDLVQEVFSILVQKLPKFRYQSNKRFRGWLWTVLLNKRREWTRRRVADPADNRSLTEMTVPSEIDELIEVEYHQYLVGKTAEFIRAEFQTKTWQAFQEYVLNERPIGDVARDLQITENAVYIAKCRVLRRLHLELAGLLE